MMKSRLMMRRKSAGCNFRALQILVVANSVDFCILHPLVVVGFLPDLHKSIVTSRY
jgi:hypothetical protein